MQQTSNALRESNLLINLMHNIIKERRDETEGNGFVLLYTVTTERWTQREIVAAHILVVCFFSYYM